MYIKERGCAEHHTLQYEGLHNPLLSDGAAGIRSEDEDFYKTI